MRNGKRTNKAHKHSAIHFAHFKQAISWFIASKPPPQKKSLRLQSFFYEHKAMNHQFFQLTFEKKQKNFIECTQTDSINLSISNQVDTVISGLVEI